MRVGPVARGQRPDRNAAAPVCTGLVGQPENFGQVNDRPRALLTADHYEMILMPVQIGDKHDTGFVEPRRCFENVPRQWNRRFEDFMKFFRPVVGKRG